MAIALIGESRLEYVFEPHALSKLGTFKARRCLYAFTRKYCHPIDQGAVLHMLHIGWTRNAKTNLTPTYRPLSRIRRAGGLFVCVSWSRTPYTDYKGPDGGLRPGLRCDLRG